MESALKYFRKRCKDLSMCLSTSPDKEKLKQVIEYNKKAAEALEKQIPQKPIHDGLYACPNCHTIMLQGAFEAKGKCCKDCGQAIDWGEN